MLALLLLTCTPPVVTLTTSPSPTAIPSASPVPTTNPTSAPPALGQNSVLGYRITLPTGYRLLRSDVYTAPGDALGQDIYTTLTVAEEQAECLRDGSDIPSPSAGALLLVGASRNPSGLSPADWSRSRVENRDRTPEPLTIGGLPAARLVQLGETMSYVIAANDRLYTIGPTMWPSHHPLADIAASFRPIAPGPFPTPTASPSESSRDAATRVAVSLAAAFSAKDADAVSRLMPACRISVAPIVGSTYQGSALSRSVAAFTAALRDRFARGDLTVTVDPAVQARSSGGRDEFFVRSSWIEPDRTIAIDLFIGESDGAWQWIQADHHYATAIAYRSPWVP